MVFRNRALVRYIWFCIELDAYDCSECEPQSRDPETWGFSDEDNVRIVNGFEALFSTLGTWEPRPSGEMLQLDISIHSPSDSEHWFKYLTFEPDLPPEECALPSAEQQSVLIRSEHDDLRHGWRAGRQVSLPPWKVFQKVFAEIMIGGPFKDEEQEMEWWRQLPLVPAVTSVLLRQQTRRRWNPQALAQLFSRFPRLQEIHYEPWREWDATQDILTDRLFPELFRSLASSQQPLERLVIFENFSPDYAAAVNEESWVPPDWAPPHWIPLIRPARFEFCSPSRIASPDVSHAVCSASLRLEQLSASFIVEASHFFDCANKHTSWAWANLTSVALTTQLLVPGASLTRIEEMLREAAATALRMLKLENMEIWNGQKEFAMLFRYQHRRPHPLPGTRRSAVITWKGTWTRAQLSRLRPPVTDAWEAVARQQNSNGVTTVEEVLSESDAAEIKSHGDAIRYLDLSSSVIRPISLRQIQMEQMIRDGGHD
ncbi:uncharacterized protein THITE_2050923 [Thermothielavioides terrestris NRRL 8126]|uniref:DUF6546 domain-containing protein n=1 Tax=Thermothielavioides terrestris (strain ATCC 38088 / NRRL 8126) TaxID=578455 RepID=G2R8L6_THETT|nr:uncharacterized protein THITE_2050923 [Thermothielavioides terrestris NRRL 8126]AEO67431.1 hypothetical protein THITE_2050923 [Thermothielavioides terrestris NRRL 8126]